MPLRVEVVESLAGTDPALWDRLVGAEEPFCEHGFLHALEASGSVGEPETGWLPRHVLVHDGAELVAAMPLYVKLDSYGEFIFDWGWADAARRARIPYYPKLVSAVPFTPVTGHRMLVETGARTDELRRVLIAAAREVATAVKASSVHVLFTTEDEQRSLTEAGMLPRLSHQYHWHNPGTWRTFDDYLASMRSSARKGVKRERRLAREHGLELTMRTGDELGDSEWAALAELYTRTCRAHGSPTYLTRGFFEQIRRRFSHRVVASFAHRDGRPVAGAFFLYRDHSLYGRYWGAREQLEAMHFELCYYLPIEWGLARGLERFEAGAQGEHKVTRGLLPAPCWSSHWLRHPGLAEAIAEFLPREAAATERMMDEVGDELSPFHRVHRDSPEREHEREREREREPEPEE